MCKTKEFRVRHIIFVIIHQMKKLIPYVILLIPLIGNAQLFEGEEYEYNSQWIWGINKNSKGGLIGGVMLRYSRSRGNDLFETYVPERTLHFIYTYAVFY